jgi:hypothetical protein
MDKKEILGILLSGLFLCNGSAMSKPLVCSNSFSSGDTTCYCCVGGADYHKIKMYTNSSTCEICVSQLQKDFGEANCNLKQYQCD